MCKLIRLVIFLLTPLFGYNQSYSDTLYVATQNGLNLRSEASEDSPIIKTLKFRDIVVFLNSSDLDTIEMREAKWIKVKTTNAVEGYVFQGFLNRERIPGENIIKEWYSFSEIKNYIKNFYKPPVIFDFIEKENTKYQYSKIIYHNKKLTSIDEYGYEWHKETILLKDWKLYELVNLISLCFFIDRNDEFENYKEAYKKDKYNIKYLSAHSDPGRVISMMEFSDGIIITHESE